MYLGRVMEAGTREQMFSKPTHPYTQALLSAAPVPDPDEQRARRRIVLGADLPEPGRPAVGLPVPHPLPDRARGAAARGRGGARAARRRRRAHRGLPPGRRARRAAEPGMTTFTTRPELSGTFGMVASTHWLASGAGMAVLERGGNAFDAAVAAGLRPAGRRAAPQRPGRRPADRSPGAPSAASRSSSAGRASRRPRATIGLLRDELGLDVVPGTGLLAACVPGAFGAWLMLLAEHGTWPLGDVLALRDRLRARRLPRAGPDRRHDRQRPRSCSRASGRLRPSCGCRRRAPGGFMRNRAAGRDLRADRARGRGGDAATATSRSSTRAPPGTRASSPRRSSTFMDTEVLDASGRRHRGLLTGERPRRLAAPPRSRRPPSTTAATPSARPGRGGRVRSFLAAARAARGARRSTPRELGRLRPHRHRGGQARLRRPRGLLRRRRRRPARHAAQPASTPPSAAG